MKPCSIQCFVLLVLCLKAEIRILR